MTGAVVTRANDLPPKWDGWAVEWHGWQYLPPAFICPPPRPECCPVCSAPTTDNGFPTTVVNRGYVARLHGKPLFRLHAFRCQVCSHDLVLDTADGVWWDLDESDYGDAGSDSTP